MKPEEVSVVEEKCVRGWGEVEKGGAVDASSCPWAEQSLTAYKLKGEVIQIPSFLDLRNSVLEHLEDLFPSKQN